MYYISLMTHFTMTFSCCQKQILFLNLRSTQNGLGFSLDNKKHRDFVLRCFFNEEKRRKDNATHIFRSVRFFFFFCLNNGHGRDRAYLQHYSVCVIQFLVSALWHKNRNQIKHILQCWVFSQEKNKIHPNFVIRFFSLQKNIAYNDGNAPPKWRLIWCVYCIVIWSRFISLRWCSSQSAIELKWNMGKHE